MVSPPLERVQAKDGRNALDLFDFARDLDSVHCQELLYMRVFACSSSDTGPK